MNTLTDLRRALDQHADDVADPTAVARTLAVHHRITAVRRRRRAAGTGALAAVVIAAVLGVVVPRSNDDAQPAGPLVLGQRAPASLTSLGYTYVATGDAQVISGSGRIRLASSDTPRLISWTLRGADTAQFTLPGRELHRTRATHFHDFLAVPSGDAQTITVRVPGGSVGVATYALSDRVAPAGYTHDGITYRARVAGRQLLGAVVGDLGQSDVSTTVVLPRGTSEMSPLCSGAPKGVFLHVELAGHESLSGSCDDSDTFDPGGRGGYSARLGSPGRTAVARVYVSTSARSRTPVAAGTFPHLRIGLGVYRDDERIVLTGADAPRVVEYGGHTWTLTDTRTAPRGPLRLAAAPEDRVAWLTWGAKGSARADFTVRGETSQGGFFATGPGGALTDLWIPAGRPATADLSHGKGPIGLAIYTRSN